MRNDEVNMNSSEGLLAGVDHPSGIIDLTELSDIELDETSGAAGTGLVGTMGCCWCVPWYSGWTVCGFVCSHPGCKR